MSKRKSKKGEKPQIAKHELRHIARLATGYERDEYMQLALARLER